MISFEVIALVIYVVGFIPLYIDLILRRRESRISFVLQRLKEPIKKPVESNWGIRILHPNKHIERCMVFYDDDPLPWWDKEECYYERMIVPNGAGIVRIPRDIEKENVEIRIKDGKQNLKKRKFKEIPIVHR
ncbi:MAG: hypothetical protein PHD13_02310 [Methanocellales archaeon]|nr:hypothetical protein [Methanocellales archaeon]MDD3291107.1 hypothetical protein [Methanocellales archaeon]MDD5234992.1 hypothetical protein [Methanocellales archaeon]MDD5484637.1 hypothetical protein [Methanocellales archaeon]